MVEFAVLLVLEDAEGVGIVVVVVLDVGGFVVVVVLVVVVVVPVGFLGLLGLVVDVVELVFVEVFGELVQGLEIVGDVDVLALVGIVELGLGDPAVPLKQEGHVPMELCKLLLGEVVIGVPDVEAGEVVADPIELVLELRPVEMVFATAELLDVA